METVKKGLLKSFKRVNLSVPQAYTPSAFDVIFPIIVLLRPPPLSFYFQQCFLSFSETLVCFVALSLVTTTVASFLI